MVKMIKMVKTVCHVESDFTVFKVAVRVMREQRFKIDSEKATVTSIDIIVTIILTVSTVIVIFIGMLHSGTRWPPAQGAM